jgi:hypothetical protein
MSDPTNGYMLESDDVCAGSVNRAIPVAQRSWIKAIKADGAFGFEPFRCQEDGGLEYFQRSKRAAMIRSRLLMVCRKAGRIWGMTTSPRHWQVSSNRNAGHGDLWRDP